MYFLGDDPANVESANAVRSQLINQGLGATVRLNPSTAEFMASVVLPTGFEVRYEEGVENAQAKLIAEALIKSPLSRVPHLRIVSNATRKFILVFVSLGG